MSALVAVGGKLLDASGRPMRATVCAKLSQPTTLAETALLRTPVCGYLDSSGRLVSQSQLAFILYATDAAGEDDEGTSPEGAVASDAFYAFTIIAQGSIQEFRAALPSASTATDPAATATDASSTLTLATFVVGSSMLGQDVTGDGIAADTVVESFDTTTNTLGLSLPTTSVVAGATVGGIAAIDDLMATPL